MSEHDEIAKKLNDQYRALQEIFDKVQSVPLAVRKPNMRLLEGETSSTWILTCADVTCAFNWIQLDPAGTESFLALAKYVVPIYSKYRVLNPKMFLDTSRPFAWLAELVQLYIVLIRNGAPNPLEGTKRIKRKSL